MVEGLVMKKHLTHKWSIENSNIPFTAKCKICGCVRYWDFDYGCIMYQWGTHTTYRAPTCLLPNTINYDGKKI